MKNKKDNIEKEYFKDNEIFSNLFNYYLFDGEEKILASNLTEGDIEYNKDSISRKRDVLKIACMKSDDKYNYLLLGIENQTKFDKDMVIRCLFYDALEYEKQRNIDKNSKNDKMKSKDKKIYYPVITIVIYFNPNPWKGPRDLYTLLGIKDEAIKKYLSNYKLNIIEPYRMEDKDFNKLNNDLSILFEFIKNSKDEDKLSKLIQSKEKYNKVNQKTIRLINEVIDLKLEIDETEEATNMCKAIEDMRKHAREAGYEEGKKEACKALEDMRKHAREAGYEEGKEDVLTNNIKTMHSNGFDIDTIARALSLDINFVKKVLA